MTPEPLSLTARTLYAELREQTLAIGATENLAETPGTVVPKTVRGNRYLYYQYRDLSGQTRQAYLGPDDKRTRRWVDQLRERAHDRAEDLQRLNELRAAFLAAGGVPMDSAPLRVLKAFADAGLLQPGPGSAVLVGTHAFNALGNLLGVRWRTHMRTQDLDLAGEADIDIALRRPRTSAPDVLEQLGMGFIPVPTLDPRSPSTSFRVRGRELRVDLLAPQVGKATGSAVRVPALNAPAQPVRFLDYLLEGAIPAAIAGRRALVLANVPLPERFALHKLLVSESRPPAFSSKAGKDRIQALQLLQVLIEEAPDDLREAKIRLVERGAGWSDRLHRALARSEREAPEVVRVIEGI
ncbi:GSU2403 family nucleotidyltransferase fold protein [Spiribacter halobius]|uniref:Nucleotidyltransferase-like domain-containing protein n=1 Tax=Sediminicurvatus halobius TaxID=2182432 RepID=A0A2U2N1I4_9GAMM|nr:GSU2403 family nucleotidyltransferase fold protein [Spiribacter halobius]PWG62927.1 hypothetical protein DEM34_10005 [Spiribacter halobius]UEX77438.1 nucleotidyltransferase domain-containing protein [Spiribacter halobius]